MHVDSEVFRYSCIEMSATQHRNVLAPTFYSIEISSAQKHGSACLRSSVHRNRKHPTCHFPRWSTGDFFQDMSLILRNKMCPQQWQQWECWTHLISSSGPSLLVIWCSAIGQPQLRQKHALLTSRTLFSTTVLTILRGFLSYYSAWCILSSLMSLWVSARV